MSGIRGTKVVLTRLETLDLERIHSWKNDISLLEQLKGYPLLSTVQDTEDWLKRNNNDRNQVLFGIREKEDNLVGVARLMFIDWISRNTELSIYLGDTGAKGKGLGKETVQ